MAAPMSSNWPISVDHIHAAADANRGVVLRTPAVPAPALSQRLGCEVHLKLECLHQTGSFKERGAAYCLSRLNEAQRAAGIVAMSAGNHAQGVALHASRLGIPATIVMPKFAPFTKVAATEALGAQVRQAGDTLEDAMDEVERLKAEGCTLIHPFDDADVIAGQGTTGLEFAEQVPGLDCVVVPIGGGGIIAGTAMAMKSIDPAISIIGVESAACPSMTDALAGRSPTVFRGPTIADGIAVKTAGKLTTPIVRDLVDDVLVVEEEDIERAIFLLQTVQRVQVEGAGASGLAGILQAPRRFAGKRVGVVICGGNIDPALLSTILMRGLAREGRLSTLRVEIQDNPGMLGAVASIVGRAGGNILEVVHRRMFFDLPAKKADLDVVVETKDRAHMQSVIAALTSEGYTSTVLDDV